MTGWIKAIALDELAAKGRAVFRHDGRQIALFHTQAGVLACNNRCPHEGYPLKEGSLDGDCLLTCNWHNWKFDLRSGKALYGGDRLRVYPSEVRDGVVWLDLTDPPFEGRRAEVLANLREAFDDNAYGRMAREIARLRVLGAEPLAAVESAIAWSHDRLEFGSTHAYAGTADWLALYDERAGDPERQIICVLEAVGHMADDVLRQPVYPYDGAQEAFDEDAFVDAIEREDRATAIALLRGGLGAGLHFTDLERGLSRAALAHYNDFGHALIYVAKAGQLIDRLGPAVEEPLLLALTRSLVFATREDRIPEFRAYGDALTAFGLNGMVEAPEAQAYRGLNVKRALALTAEHGGAPPEALYGALLAANAGNMLAYDSSYQESFERPLQDNVGWLSFTHGLTFANAVRRQCAKFAQLWPAGLLQMACFSGRNAPYTDASIDPAPWHVEDPEGFFEAAIDGLFDHGKEEFIVSVHLVKTLLAARQEVRVDPDGPASALIVAALNRFLHAPLKRKHVRRTVRQAMAFVELDG
jgi:nitrite reductase/ring-hydroxylating ferredoxin subunit